MNGKPLRLEIILAVICLFFGGTAFAETSEKIKDFPLPEASYEVSETVSQDHDTAFGNESSENYEEVSEADIGDDSKYSEMTYTIRKGDTLGSISKKFFGTTRYWKKIASLNGIDNPSKMRVGKVIKIPGNLGKGTTKRQSKRKPSLPKTTVEYSPVNDLPSVEQLNSYSLDPVPLPSPPGKSDVILYQEKGLPKIILPELVKKEDTSRNMVTLSGITGMTQTFAAYPLGKGKFSTSFGVLWNKITKRDGQRLKVGEDGDYYQFPVSITYAAENFEVALCLPFESYDIYAPITYNFRDGSDSGMGDASLRLKFSSQNDNMASCLGVGAIFPTNDRIIGRYENDNAWEIFGGFSTKRTEGGNLHVNVGYQADDGNTEHEGIFANVGFDYKANESFNFMGEIVTYNRVNDGRSTDLVLSMRYYAKPGMSFTLSAPISLKNDMFFGYDYRLLGQIQYNY